MGVTAFTSPVPYAVYQRRLAWADDNKADFVADAGALPGRALVPFTGKAAPNATYGLRVMTTEFPRQQIMPELLLRTDAQGRFHVTLALPAGGWYLANLRLEDESITVGPFGVGEVYLIAGQSFVGNYHSSRLAVSEPRGRVAAFNLRKRQWRVAHDPQPTPDFPDEGEGRWAHVNKLQTKMHLQQRFDGGSVWPMVGDMLVGVLGVPVGFANISFGGSPIKRWHPEHGRLFDLMAEAARQLGRFRAVLWAQGESDVESGLAAEDWAKRLKQIQKALAGELDFQPDWLVAKSTRHPSAYDQPEREDALRSAIDRLWRRDSTIFPGADTDRLLGEENRAGIGDSAHFSAEGQRRAAWLWFHAIMAHVEHREALAAAAE